MSKKISVLMAVYNDEINLPKSIDSILNQSYQNFEFLILDDCSSDGTLDVLHKYAERDHRIKIFKNDKNIGLTKSLNYLINKCSGEIIARQDSDDVSYKTRFNMQIKFMEENNLDACSSLAKIKGKNKVIPFFSRYFNPKYVINFKNPVIHGSLMIYSKVLKDLGMYDEKFYYAQDYKLVKDLIKGSYKLKILKKVLYELNMVNNISQIYNNEQKYFADCVKKNKAPVIDLNY